VSQRQAVLDGGCDADWRSNPHLRTRVVVDGNEADVFALSGIGVARGNSREWPTRTKAGGRAVEVDGMAVAVQ